MACRIFTLALIAFGTVNARITPKIIGGRDAEDVYPYQASLRVRGSHVCGGSVIDHQWILTAGHCLLNRNLNTFSVVLGSNNVHSGGILYHPEQLIVHPEYYQKQQKNDIGLIKIQEYIEYTKEIAPINLPTEDVDESDCVGVFTGWGNTQKADAKGNLQEIDLKVLEFSKCHETFPVISPTNLCTFTTEGEGLCYGDSGSPLVANGVQIAIGSWGTPCARGFPDVHTRVYSYIDWIKSYTE